MMAVTLFENKRDCCGCGACVNVCSRNAISMQQDEYGFRYPHVDASQCVDCGICLNTCPIRKSSEKAEPERCYAVAAKDEAVLRSSSSGGAFAVLAAAALSRGGVVYGVAMPLESGKFSPKHIRISDISELTKLQGSKYVQSDTAFTYTQVKNDLLEGKEVLYSGTPCQIAGLLKFLGGTQENLLTVEVICHGVPNAKMFRDFIEFLEEKEERQVVQFDFRSKEKGTGIQVGICYQRSNGKINRVIKSGYAYSYVFYFLRGLIYRESCYNCPFAEGKRVADLTVGDYWGFHQEHPDISPKTQLCSSRGVSCVLVNSEKGYRSVSGCEDSFVLVETRFEKIARHNAQLCNPTGYSQTREYLMEMYREKGYSALDRYYQKAYGKVRLKQACVSVVPGGVKRTLRRVAGRIYRNPGE